MSRSDLTLVSALVLVMAAGLGNTAFAQNGRMDRELEQLYSGTNINPFDAAASNNLALKLFRQGQYERALKLLQRAQRLAPERLHIKQNAEYLQLLMSQVENLDEETASSLSRTYENEEIPFVPEPWGQWGRRIDAASGSEPVERSAYSNSSGASSNPFDVDSLMIIADIKIDKGDLRGALTDLKRAARISPWVSGLSERIARLQAQLPTNIDLTSTGVENLRTITADPEVADVPPPAAWTIDDQPRRYLE